MDIESNYIALARAPTACASLATFKAISAAKSPIRRGRRALFNHIRFGQVVRVIRREISPSGKHDMKVCGQVAVAINPIIDDVKALRKRKYFAMLVIPGGVYHMGEIVRVDNVAGNMESEKPHARDCVIYLRPIVRRTIKRDPPCYWRMLSIRKGEDLQVSPHSTLRRKCPRKYAGK